MDITSLRAVGSGQFAVYADPLIESERLCGRKRECADVRQAPEKSVVKEGHRACYIRSVGIFELFAVYINIEVDVLDACRTPIHLRCARAPER